MKQKRISKDQYYLNIAKEVGARCNCLMVAYGAIIVNEDQIISTGYVGAPRKTKDCMDLGFCLRRERNVESGTRYEMCRSVHAEMNAIINAARAGTSVLGATMYLYAAKKTDEENAPINAYPCLLCKKMIINAGIKEFVGNDEKGNIRRYKVSDWIKDWQKLEDITLDRDKYAVTYGKNFGKRKVDKKKVGKKK